MGVIGEAKMPDLRNLLIPALALGSLAIALFWGYWRSRKRTATAQGTVLRVKFGWNQRVNVPRPIVEFEDLHGQRFEFESGNGASWNPWPEGSSVRVRYDPADPTNAEIELTAGFVVPVAILGAVALFIVGLVVFEIFTN
jgi:Protein of unknown function (DUF3592)